MRDLSTTQNGIAVSAHHPSNGRKAEARALSSAWRPLLRWWAESAIPFFVVDWSLTVASTELAVVAHSFPPKQVKGVPFSLATHFTRTHNAFLPSLLPVGIEVEVGNLGHLLYPLHATKLVVGSWSMASNQ